MLAEIREAMLMIERFRARWNRQWAEPPITDALKFALTEGGEEQRDQIAQALVLGLGTISTVTFFAGTSFALQVKHQLGTEYRNLLEPIREVLYAGQDQGFTSSFEMMYRIARIGMMQEEDDSGWIAEAVILVCEIMGSLDSEETMPQLLKKRLDRIEYRLAATLEAATAKE